MSAYKINSVLIPVDLSEGSLNALDAAVIIAKKHGAALYILHVDENSFQTMEDVSAPYFSNGINAPDVIAALVGAIQHTHGIQPVILQEEGNVTDIIVKTSFIHRADLIVMGAHGASGYRDGFIGNNTYNVIKYATCPVLSVPQRKKMGTIRRILFPIRPVTGALMPYGIVRAFTQPNAVIDVLGLTYRMMINTATSVLDTLVGEIKEQLKNDQVMARPSWIEGNNIADEIVDWSHKTSPDIVIVTSALDVTSKPKYIGPHAQKIIHSSKAPVLSIKKLNVPSLV